MKTVPADSKDFDSKAEYKDKDGQELQASAKMDALRPLSLLLSEGFDIDSRDRNGATPLMWTALYGQQGALKVNGGFSLVH